MNAMSTTSRVRCWRAVSTQLGGTDRIFQPGAFAASDDFRKRFLAPERDPHAARSVSRIRRKERRGRDRREITVLLLAGWSSFTANIPTRFSFFVWRNPVEVYRSVLKASETSRFFSKPGMLSRLIYHQEQAIRQSDRIEKKARPHYAGGLRETGGSNRGGLPGNQRVSGRAF
jgi:hypothetical protein